MSSVRVRIVVADDHALVREGIRRVLEEDPGFEVVAEAADGEETLALVAATAPDVVVLDISMPRLSGLDVTRRLRDEHPKVRTLILSMHDDTEYVLRAVRAGAAGYLLKDDAGPQLLRQAVRAVHAGDSFFSPAVASRLTDALRSDPSASDDPFGSLTGHPTPRGPNGSSDAEGSERRASVRRLATAGLKKESPAWTARTA
ncbi:MAG: response regulator transcription factor, partial [Gemmatimonadota bacterium]